MNLMDVYEDDDENEERIRWRSVKKLGVGDSP